MYRSLHLLIYCIQLFRRTTISMPKTTRPSCLAYISWTGFSSHIYFVVIIRKMKTNATSFGSCSRIYFCEQRKIRWCQNDVLDFRFEGSVLPREKQWFVHWFRSVTIHVCLKRMLPEYIIMKITIKITGTSVFCNTMERIKNRRRFC